MVVRGTKKFRQRVAPPVAAAAEPSNALGDWYANALFWRPQVALFVNEQTFLPVFVPLAPAASVVERLPDAFAAVATRVGVDGLKLAAEVVAMCTYELAPTASRSVLGVMNDFVHQADNYRWRHEVIDLVELSLWLAHTPCGPLFTGVGYPDLALRERLA